MTTIAFDGENIASDGLIVSSFIETTKYKKITLNPLNDIIAVGVSGSMQEHQSFISWLTDGGMDYSIQPHGDYSVLCVRDDGVVFDVDMNTGKGFKYKFFIDSKFTSIGSGSSFALGAMSAGATAKQAVKIAKTLDVNTGGKVRSYKLFNNKGNKT